MIDIWGGRAVIYGLLGLALAVVARPTQAFQSVGGVGAVAKAEADQGAGAPGAAGRRWHRIASAPLRVAGRALRKGPQRLVIAGGLVGSTVFIATQLTTAAPGLAVVAGIVIGGVLPKVFEHQLNRVSDHVRKVFSPQVGGVATKPGNSVLSPWKHQFLERTYDQTNAQIEQRISWMRELVGKLSLLTEQHLSAAGAAMRDAVPRVRDAASSVAAAVLHVADYPDVDLPDELTRRVLLPLRALNQEQLAVLWAGVVEALHAVAPVADRAHALQVAQRWLSSLARTPHTAGLELPAPAP